MIQTIAVAGAGTMGSGIAQVVAKSGYQTILFDTSQLVLDKAAINIKNGLQYLVEKKSITELQQKEIFERIYFTSHIDDCKADVIIEAILETVTVKAALFNQLALINTAETIFASNTSSLSISVIQANIIHPQRFIGMHFFNPAPVMKLVEIVRGDQTNTETIQAITALCENINKVAIVCKDAPGFIVNRIARQYYLEAMQLVEQGIASVEQVDDIMEATGFKMGPFRLMDLIGMDVNLAVSESIYKAFNETRLAPSSIQIEMVSKGELGRKAGKGFYNY